MYEIKNYCKENNITMRELAREINISLSYFSKIDRNIIIPNERIKNELEKRGIIKDIEK